MKRYRIMILMIVASCIFCACPKLDEESSSIIVVNRTNKIIGFQERLLKEPLASEDTLLQKFPVIIGVYADTLCSLPAGPNSDWRRKMHGCSYLQILIVDIDNYIDNYDKYITAPTDTLRKYVPVLKRYLFTLSDLERMNWTVVYPPRGATQAVEQSVHNKKEKR